mmetsp:Transcript_70268/g.194369  ORF Transcript_70268/g.194369 Transcript_70268/m.194369 type:complete len:365 (+) Transcript_70268:339-1433(+)
MVSVHQKHSRDGKVLLERGKVHRFHVLGGDPEGFRVLHLLHRLRARKFNALHQEGHVLRQRAPQRATREFALALLGARQHARHREVAILELPHLREEPAIRAGEVQHGHGHHALQLIVAALEYCAAAAHDLLVQLRDALASPHPRGLQHRLNSKHPDHLPHLQRHRHDDLAPVREGASQVIREGCSGRHCCYQALVVLHSVLRAEALHERLLHQPRDEAAGADAEDLADHARLHCADVHPVGPQRSLAEPSALPHFRARRGHDYRSGRGLEVGHAAAADHVGTSGLVACQEKVVLWHEHSHVHGLVAEPLQRVRVGGRPEAEEGVAENVRPAKLEVQFRLQGERQVLQASHVCLSEQLLGGHLA